MKRFMPIIILFIYLFSFQPTIFAAENSPSGDPSVYDAIKQDQKASSKQETNTVDSSSPTLFPLFMKFIISFAVVIILLVLLLRFLSKKNRLIHTNGPVLPLGGHVLGNNRSLQVLLIGQTIYIVGVGENVTLLRSISQGEEYQHLLEGFETQAEPNWFSINQKNKWKSVFGKHLDRMQEENGEE